MQIQPITYQPSYKGQLKSKGVMLLKDSHWNVPKEMDKNLCLKIPDNLLNKMRALVKEKTYNVYVSLDKNNPELLDICAGDSFESAQNVLSKKIKVHRNAIDAFPQAIQESMDVFEERVRNLKAKIRYSSKESG